MSRMDINIVYTDLNQLLADICSLLSKVVDGTISDKDKQSASILIQRSKTQLQVLSKIPTEDEFGRYVDMDKKRTDDVISEYIEPQIVPNPTDDSKVDASSNISSSVTNLKKYVEVTSCPYYHLTAAEASTDKFGYLERREKFIVSYFHYGKKVFAAVVNKWLLIYYSEKDSKPYDTYDMQLYEVSPVRDKSFQLTLQTLTDSSDKILFFTATTSKDMLQWIAAINRSKEVDSSTLPKPVMKQAKITRTPPSTLLLKNQNNESNITLQTIDQTDAEDDQIYEELQPSRLEETAKEMTLSSSKLKPVLPPRVPMEPPLPQRNQKIFVEILNEKKNEHEHDDSFSEEEKEQPYDVIESLLKNNVNVNVNAAESLDNDSEEFENIDEEDVEYDFIHEEKEEMKKKEEMLREKELLKKEENELLKKEEKLPKSPTSKPLPMLKPKLSSIKKDNSMPKIYPKPPEHKFTKH